MIGLLFTDNNKKQKNKTKKTNNMELLDKLNWDTKAMNGTKVPQEKIDNIIEGSHLLQLQVVYNLWGHCNYKSRSERKIRPISWINLVTDCSHLFVFAAWDTYTADRINKMFDLTNTFGIWKRRLGKLPSNV
jgi:hypothetical protein